MSTLAEFMIVAEFKENGRIMLNSVKSGLLIWPTKVDEQGNSRVRKYEELSAIEKLQADCDLRAANLVLQGLPPDPRICTLLMLGLKRLHGFLEVTVAQVRNRSRFGINKWYQSLALRNFDLEDMELESTNSGPTAKLPILKLGEYEMWAIRIKQYFQIQDYALWEVIENGDSWVSISQTTEENGITVSKMSTPATAEEKTKKKNDVKARGLLLMALPNEHQLTFSQYPDAKSMFAAIETRFGGNAATKKTQKTLLKQQYENFSATSAESLDSIFNRLQKIVSRLAILGVIIAQEDLNLKFLSSLPPEWNTHVVVWMNKPEIETMSIDDLYNNFKIVEQKIKKTVGTSSGVQNLAFMTAPSSSSTNDANTASSQVSAASPSVNTASPQVCTASVSDNTVYAFMVENPNGSNVLHQDLEQIHEDDLEAMDLKWQLSLLSVRAKKYYQKTGRKIFINGNNIDRYDKSKVECYNCHKLGHFARECRASRSKEDQFRNQDNTRKQRNKEDTSKAMLAIDGVDSEVYTDKTCSKTCLNNYETLKKQYDDLLAKQLQTKFEASTYKRGLDTVEAQLVTYRKNEITDKSKKGLGYSAVPPPHPLIYNRPNKLDLSYSGLDEFKEPEFKGYGPENSKKESNVVCEKESDNSKENSDKSLVKEQESQVKSSFVEGFKSNTSKNVSEVEPKKVRKNNDALIIEDWVSDDEEQDESMTKPEKKTVIPTAAKIEKPVKKSVRYAEMYRSQRPRGNQRNWNGQKSNQLGSEFVMYNKACFNCGSFKHVQKNCTYHQKKKVASGNNYNRVDNYYYAKTSHHRTHKNVTPRAVLLRTGLKSLSIAKLVYTAGLKSTVHCARPKTHFFKSAQSTIQRPFYKNPSLTNMHFNHKVNIVRPRIVNTARSYRTPVNTVRPRVINTARQNRTLVNVARVNRFNVVKPSGKPQHDDKGFVDNGCSRHMTGNKAYLSDFKQFDGGYVAFRGGAYGGKISSKENYYCQANVNVVKRTWAPKLQLFSNSYHLRHCLRGGISQEVRTPRYLSLVVPLTKVGDEAVYKELGDKMERAATAASSLEAEQDSGSGPRCQDSILGDVNAQTRFEITSIQSIDPPLLRGYTLGSGEDSMKLIGIDKILYTTVI
ncbi:putative ribonuclease H-like domain-containing protein [Tanacetum coccineum]